MHYFLRFAFQYPAVVGSTEPVLRIKTKERKTAAWCTLHLPHSALLLSLPSCFFYPFCHVLHCVLTPLVLRRTPRMPTWKAMSHIQAWPRTSLSHHLSVTLPLNPAQLPHSRATTLRVPWTTGSVDPAPPPLHWTTALLLLLPPPPAGPGVLRIPAATLPRQGGTVAARPRPSTRWTFTLLTIMLPLPLQLSPHHGRVACRPLPALTPMLSATRLCRTGTTARLRPPSTCPPATEVYLRIV